VERARRELGVSERRACRVLTQPRSTQRYEGLTTVMELRLTRRITELLRQEGFRVNHKRVERIWRQERLKVPKE